MTPSRLYSAGLQEAHSQPGAESERLRVHSRSEEHTSELQSLRHLVCRLLLEKKNNDRPNHATKIRMIARHTGTAVNRHTVIVDTLLNHIAAMHRISSIQTRVTSPDSSRRHGT